MEEFINKYIIPTIFICVAIICILGVIVATIDLIYQITTGDQTIITLIKMRGA